MRVSTSFSQQLGIDAILKQQAKLLKSQMQLSTGLRVLKPSDDPAAAVRTLDLQESIEKTRQYQDNLTTVRSRLNIEETALDSSEKVMFRAKELTLQALNAPLNDQDRRAIKAEIDQLLEHLVGIANTKSANGEHIFSGGLSREPAYQWDTTAQAYGYQGGKHQRVLDIGPERQIADGDLGFTVFENIASSSIEASTQGGVQSVFDTLQSLSDTLDGNYTVPAGTLTGARMLKFGHDFSAGPVDFNLAVDGGAATTVTLAAANYNNLNDLVDGVNAGINASALNGQVSARANGNAIEFVSTAKGSASSVEISDDTDGFLSATGFSDLQTGIGAEAMGSIVGSNSLLSGHDYSSNPASFQLVADNLVTVDITLNNNFADLSAIVAEINSQITTAGQNNKMAAQINGNSVELVSYSAGAAASIQIVEQSGTFLQDAGFSDQQTGRLFDSTLANSLKDIDSALVNFLQVRTSVGARLNALDDQESHNEKFIIDMQTTLSEVRDLDFAEAISKFNLENIALQAAQQAFAKVQNLSLFNFLR